MGTEKFMVELADLEIKLPSEKSEPGQPHEPGDEQKPA